ncbi:aldo/keto reductase [soil metagenome]
MKYARLGRTGLEVSRIAFGCMSIGVPGERRPWTLGEAEARPLYRYAWDNGINFFDTANSYSEGSSEEITGKLIKELAPRDEIVLATKVFNRMRPGANGAGLNRKTIFAQLDASLKRLNTDYVDLYQIHRWDSQTPIEETLDALTDTVRAGKVRYIGASSMYAWQFAKALFTADKHGYARFVSMQNQVNLVYREEEREVLPLCADQGIGVIPWSQLSSGKLTRPWGEQTKRTTTDANGRTMYQNDVGNQKAVVQQVGILAQAHGLPMAQIAMAWLLRKPMVTAPIVGVTKLDHVKDAIAALDVTLSADEAKALDAPYTGRPIVGNQ